MGADFDVTAILKANVSDFKNGEMVLNVAKNDKYFFLHIFILPIFP